MNSISSIAGSGIKAATQGLAASAHNVANLATAGFRPQQAVQAEQPGGGVTASVAPTGQDGTDLAAETVRRMTLVYAFKANLRSIEVETEMSRALIDARA